jgi:hypothetical protein
MKKNLLVTLLLAAGWRLEPCRSESRLVRPRLLGLSQFRQVPAPGITGWADIGIRSPADTYGMRDIGLVPHTPVRFGLAPGTTENTSTKVIGRVHAGALNIAMNGIEIVTAISIIST